jgi:hypothetical protein
MILQEQLGLTWVMARLDSAGTRLNGLLAWPFQVAKL